MGAAGNIDFSLGLRLFGGEQKLRAVILDDTEAFQQEWQDFVLDLRFDR